jgi:hypothetical protein
MRVAGIRSRTEEGYRTLRSGFLGVPRQTAGLRREQRASLNTGPALLSWKIL